MKKIIFLVITVLLVFVVVIVIAEIGFRISDLFDKNRGLKNCMGNIDSQYYYDFTPNREFRLIASKNNEYDVGIRINNHGFRGRDVSRKKKPKTTRIMAMGDSFVFGIGAREDQTIPFLFEKFLAKEGVNAEVINAGFGSYSPLLHYLKTKDKYLKFKPDLVLYFFDFSDLSDDWRYERSLVYDDKGGILRCDPTFINGRRDWWKVARVKSKACVFIHNKILRLIDKIRILGFKNYIKAKIEGKKAKALIVKKQAERRSLNLIEYDGYLMIRGRKKAPEIEEHFKRTEKYLNLIKDSLAQEKIPMILVLYPYGIHVGPDQWGAGREFWGFEKGKLYKDYYAFDLLEDYARRNDIKYINLLPAFLEESKEKLFFDIDGHFTPKANAIVAERLVHSVILKEALDDLSNPPLQN